MKPEDEMRRHYFRYGEWAIPGYSDTELHFIPIVPVWEMVQDRMPITLNYSDVAYFPLYKSDIYTRRFREADTSYPPIAITNVPNPRGQRYRVIDGRHRHVKNILAGYTSSMFHVLDFREVEPLIRVTSGLITGKKVEEIYKYNKDLFLEV